MLDVEFAEHTDTGRVRRHNEDYAGHAAAKNAAEARTHGWLFVVADGVGGQELGEVASRVAVESMISGFREASKGEALTSLLPRLVQAANAQVVEEGLAAAGSGGASMATTLVACALRFDRAVVAHVGDSRCYLVRSGHAHALTRDHTVVSEQVRIGVLSSSEAAAAATRHVLSRSLGAELFVSAEVSETQVLRGDVLVLCSDGLHDALEAQEIASVISHARSLNQAARDLVALANDRDGGDNITVQLVRVRDVERVGMYRGRPYRL
jgi:protein phosphatase